MSGPGVAVVHTKTIHLSQQVRHVILVCHQTGARGVTVTQPVAEHVRVQTEVRLAPPDHGAGEGPEPGVPGAGCLGLAGGQRAIEGEAFVQHLVDGLDGTLPSVVPRDIHGPSM